MSERANVGTPDLRAEWQALREEAIHAASVYGKASANCAHTTVEGRIAAAADMDRTRAALDAFMERHLFGAGTPEPDAWCVRYADGAGKRRRSRTADGSSFWQTRGLAKRRAEILTELGYTDVRVEPVYIGASRPSEPVAPAVWEQRARRWGRQLIDTVREVRAAFPDDDVFRNVDSPSDILLMLADAEPVPAVTLALKEAVELCREAMDAGYGHAHWDSTQMHGAGCPLCISRREANDRISARLAALNTQTDTPTGREQ